MAACHPHTGTRSRHRISFGRIFAAVALTLPCLNVSAWGDDGPTDWRKAEAGRYLDERAKAWFAFGDAGRGQSETKTRCVSCHTVTPYAIARPALRKLTGLDQQTEFENKLIVQTKLRVEHWDELDSEKFQLLYDSDERKKRESWGTESVLNAVILAFDDHYQGRQSPSDSTRQAFANMWRTQAVEGSRQGSWDSRGRPGTRGGAVRRPFISFGKVNWKLYIEGLAVPHGFVA
jgi:hypothetical protein